MCEDEEYVAAIRGAVRAGYVVRRRPSDGEDSCIRELFLGAICSIFGLRKTHFGHGNLKGLFWNKDATVSTMR